MTSAPNPRPVIEHGATGTLVVGTSRDDVDLIAALKGQGFRWSRRLDAWYLPRPWSLATREQRVAALQAAAPGAFVVERSATPRQPATERAAERQVRAAARAARLDARASAAQERAEAAEQAAHDLADRIPMGQPILLGHHSQRRHQRDLDRIHHGLRKALSEQAKASDNREAAARARAAAQGVETIVTIGNRIERIEAEIRRTQRHLAAAEGTYRGRLQVQLEELADELTYHQAKLAAAGDVPYSRENVKAGDFVRVRGTWYPVTRANAKTVTLPSALVPATSRTTNTTPWREVTDHLARSHATREQILAMARSISPAFPGLRERLERTAGEDQ